MNEIDKLVRISGLTQAQVAAKVGVAPQRISEYIRGKRAISLERLKKWCAILEVDIKRLF